MHQTLIIQFDNVPDDISDVLKEKFPNMSNVQRQVIRTVITKFRVEDNNIYHSKDSDAFVTISALIHHTQSDISYLRIMGSDCVEYMKMSVMAGSKGKKGLSESSIELYQNPNNTDKHRKITGPAWDLTHVYKSIRQRFEELMKVLVSSDCYKAIDVSRKGSVVFEAIYHEVIEQGTAIKEDVVNNLNDAANALTGSKPAPLPANPVIAIKLLNAFAAVPKPIQKEVQSIMVHTEPEVAAPVVAPATTHMLEQPPFVESVIEPILQEEDTMNSVTRIRREHAVMPNLGLQLSIHIKTNILNNIDPYDLTPKVRFNIRIWNPIAAIRNKINTNIKEITDRRDEQRTTAAHREAASVEAQFNQMNNQTEEDPAIRHSTPPQSFNEKLWDSLDGHPNTGTQG